jgi:hypothetical protein
MKLQTIISHNSKDMCKILYNQTIIPQEIARSKSKENNYKNIT